MEDRKRSERRWAWVGVGIYFLNKKGMVDLNTGDWVPIDVERSGALMGLAIW